MQANQKSQGWVIVVRALQVSGTTRQIILRLVAHAARPGECILIFLPGINEIADIQDELDPSAATRGEEEGGTGAVPAAGRPSRAQSRQSQGSNQTPLQVPMSLAFVFIQGPGKMQSGLSFRLLGFCSLKIV
jgi:hypothetical protein